LSAQPAGAWLPGYARNLAGYCFRWWRGRVGAWLVTAIAIGAVLSLAATAELFLVMSVRTLSQQTRSASEFQVFLADDAKPQEVDVLTARIATLRSVRRVDYRSKEEALNLARRDSSLAEVAQYTWGNPFPASLVVQLDDPAAAGEVVAVANGDPAVDPSVPFSYTPSQGIQASRFLGAVRALVLGIALGALAIAALVAFVLLRSEISARTTELRILTLLGIPRQVIRLPVLMEGVSLGLVGSLLAALTLVVIGERVLPDLSQALPFMRLGTSTAVLQTIAGATMLGSVLTLGGCGWFVRLPR
jgi:cell division transport system permease protein